MVMQEVALARSGDYFRADEPVFAETGAVIWLEDDALVVEHPDGAETRHSGTWVTDDRIPGHVAMSLRFEVGTDVEPTDE
jgi:hypothetical protein